MKLAVMIESLLRDSFDKTRGRAVFCNHTPSIDGYASLCNSGAGKPAYKDQDYTEPLNVGFTSKYKCIVGKAFLRGEV